jgi:hypothetical protein
MNGWIKLHRKLLLSRYGSNLEFIGLFAALLIKATHKDGFAPDGTAVNAGQVLTSQTALAKEFKTSRGKIQRVLRKFVDAEQIEQKTSNKNTLITILNWSKYQSEDEQQASSKRAPNEQQASTFKNVKNVKNVKNEREKTPSPLSEHFKDPAIIAWLNSGSAEIASGLLLKFDLNYLKVEVQKAYQWQVEGQKRYANQFLLNWMDRCKDPQFKGGMSHAEIVLGDFIKDEGLEAYLVKGLT